MFKPHFHLPQAEALLNICLQSCGALACVRSTPHAQQGGASEHFTEQSIPKQTSEAEYYVTTWGGGSPHLIVFDTSFPVAAFIDTNSWQALNFPSNRVVRKSLKERKEIKWNARPAAVSHCMHQAANSKHVCIYFSFYTHTTYCKATVHDLNCTISCSITDDGRGEHFLSLPRDDII